MHTIKNWLKSNSDWAILMLRIFVGLRLCYGVLDNVFSWSHMLEFKHFLIQFNFPLPMISAITSVYLQLLAGLCFILGLYTRYAAVLMILNFLIALIMVHASDSFEGMTPALTMLFCSVVFLFYGPGRLALAALKKGK